MKRWVLLSPLTVLAVAACNDVQSPPAANFQVRDGNHDSSSTYQYLYFLPPIVPTPTLPTGAKLDYRLLSYLSVEVHGPWQPTGDGTTIPWDAPDNASCSNTLTTDLSGGLSVDTTSGTYATAWNTKKKGPGAVGINQVYRLCVWLKTVPAAGNAPRLLGYRDVMPDSGGADQPRNTEQSPVYQFGAGSNVPVKFQILQGVLDPALCTGGTLGNNYDCTAQILSSNETAVCDGASCSITTGIMAAPELFLVEKFGTQSPACFTSPGTSSIAGFPLSMDIPQYAGCVRVTLFDDNDSFTGFLNSYGTIGACFYPESGVALKPGQDESIQMHVQYPNDANGNPVVWALPWAQSGEITEVCDIAKGGMATRGGISGFLASARKVLRKAQEVVDPWFAPPQVLAFHTGFGGHTSLSPDESSTTLLMASLSADTAVSTKVQTANVTCSSNCPPKVYNLDWALPSQMATDKFCAGPSCTGVATSPFTVNKGDVVTVAVKVTDNGAVEDAQSPGGRALGTSRTVNGANVWFDASSDANPAIKLTTGADGLATFQWPANTEGTTTITASGFGIGTSGGPFDAFVNGTYADVATRLQLGQLSWQVKVCPVTPAADGWLDATDPYYQGKTWTAVPVNLGGSTADTARMLIDNDCDNLYIAFLVPADEATNNSLRFVFDNSGNGESADDDILSLARNASGVFVLADRYLSSACVGSKQADCGPTDLAPPTGSGFQGSGGAHLNQFDAPGYLGRTQWFVYEIKHPLRGSLTQGTFQDDFDRVAGQNLWWYAAISLGNGSKGNSEFPDQKGNFKNYATYAVH